MKKATFTQFRQRAKRYFDAVEAGETIRIFRYGKPIADVVPLTAEEATLSWKKAGPQLSIKGVSLSELILKMRDEAER